MKLYSFLFIICLSLIPITYASSNDLLFSLSLEYNYGNITIKDIKLIKGYAPNVNDIGRYSLSMYSFNATLLYNTKFDIPTKIAMDLPRGNFTQKLYTDEDGSYGFVTLVLPYFKNAKTIKIFKGEELKLEIDISSFATCNENNICDNRETHELCPDECLCGNGKCDPGESYQTCSQDCPYVTAESESLSIWQRILLFVKSIIARV